jgi:hypothetical protein
MPESANDGLHRPAEQARLYVLRFDPGVAGPRVAAAVPAA